MIENKFGTTLNLKFGFKLNLEIEKKRNRKEKNKTTTDLGGLTRRFSAHFRFHSSRPNPDRAQRADKGAPPGSLPRVLACPPLFADLRGPLGRPVSFTDSFFTAMKSRAPKLGETRTAAISSGRTPVLTLPTVYKYRRASSPSRRVEPAPTVSSRLGERDELVPPSSFLLVGINVSSACVSEESWR